MLLSGLIAFTDIAWIIDEVMAGKRVKHLQKLASKNVAMLPRMLTTPSYIWLILKIAEGRDNCFALIALFRVAWSLYQSSL